MNLFNSMLDMVEQVDYDWPTLIEEDAAELLIIMNWLENKLDSLITTIARHGKLECRDCGTFYPKGYPCRCSCAKYPQVSNPAQMTKEKFDENALYQFALDVNQFGHEVAAEMLIRSMKAWVKSNEKQI